MGDVVSTHLDEAKREIVAGEELFVGAVSPVLAAFTGCSGALTACCLVLAAASEHWAEGGKLLQATFPSSVILLLD